MKALENIGFYTLSDKRAKELSSVSPLQRCELILTSRCNFKCTYCRGMLEKDKGDMSFIDAVMVVRSWAKAGLQNIRFSGGEPTLWKNLIDLVKIAKHYGIKRCALSTNGSKDLEFYKELHKAGIDDFSISLDSCCAATGNKMAGDIPIFNVVINNIKELSKITYVTVGVVLTDENQHELNDIISFADSLGVSDIRIIPAAQVRKEHKDLKIGANLDKYPILKYRTENFLNSISVRGIKEADNHLCPLVIDDMAVMNGKHYPCIIYMREHGKEIGKFTTIEEVKAERLLWARTHNCFEDKICKNNCLDVCIAYNNRVKELNNNL
jgi:MoaA/NifB/PqqE/SkfB family radical SAM enzyme